MVLDKSQSQENKHLELSVLLSQKLKSVQTQLGFTWQNLVNSMENLSWAINVQTLQCYHLNLRLDYQSSILLLSFVSFHAAGNIAGCGRWMCPLPCKVWKLLKDIQCYQYPQNPFTTSMRIIWYGCLDSVDYGTEEWNNGMER